VRPVRSGTAVFRPLSPNSIRGAGQNQSAATVAGAKKRYEGLRIQ
jgi:hypothetical protein